MFGFVSADELFDCKQQNDCSFDYWYLVNITTALFFSETPIWTSDAIVEQTSFSIALRMPSFLPEYQGNIDTLSVSSRKTSSNEWETAMDGLAVDTGTVTLPNLEPGQDYLVRVTAYSSDGKAYPGHPLPVNTPASGEATYLMHTWCVDILTVKKKGTLVDIKMLIPISVGDDTLSMCKPTSRMETATV